MVRLVDTEYASNPDWINPYAPTGERRIDTDPVRNFFALAAAEFDEARETLGKNETVDRMVYSLKGGKQLEVRPGGYIKSKTSLHRSPSEPAYFREFDAVIRGEDGEITDAASFSFPMTKDRAFIRSQPERGAEKEHWYLTLGYPGPTAPRRARFVQVGYILGAIRDVQQMAPQPRIMKRVYQ